ncbi:MAG: MFS transporter [Thermoanaerobaculia bacterium]
MSWREQPEYRSTRSSFDGRGLAVLTVFLVPLVVALMQAPDWGWGSPAVLLLLALSALALAAFAWTERRVAEPLLELGQLRRPTVVGANLAIFSSQFSKIGVLVFGSLFLQDRLGFSPLAAGTAMLAAVAPWLITNLLSGWMTDRFGPRLPTLLGVAALVGSMAWLAVAVTAESYAAMLPGLILWGLARRRAGCRCPRRELRRQRQLRGGVLDRDGGHHRRLGGRIYAY